MSGILLVFAVAMCTIIGGTWWLGRGWLKSGNSAVKSPYGSIHRSRLDGSGRHRRSNRSGSLPERITVTGAGTLDHWENIDGTYRWNPRGYYQHEEIPHYRIRK